jgi:hypothetical protein
MKYIFFDFAQNKSELKFEVLKVEEEKFYSNDFYLSTPGTLCTQGNAF